MTVNARTSKRGRPAGKGGKTKRRPQARRRPERATRVSYPMPRRLVVIGDLNGDDDALLTLLRGLQVVDRSGSWIADGTHVVQLGDVVNRGSGCRAALERLHRLSEEAPARGSRLTVILGNHEAMVALHNHAWCHPEEYLEFATAAERERFELLRSRRIYELLEQRTQEGRTRPISGALRSWEEENVPGRAAYEAAFSSRGPLGRFIRDMPVAVRVGPVLLVHGGLLPRFVDGGLERLDRSVRDLWARDPATAWDLPPESPLTHEEGPLWCRGLAAADEREARGLLEATLAATRTSVMMVGHTRTDLIGGERGVPLARFGGRLVCADVGIGSSGGAPAAVYVEKGVIWCWRPDDRKRRLGPLPDLLT